MKLKSALTPAQKQKAYRERKRENAQNNNGNVTDKETQQLSQSFNQELEKVGFDKLNTEQKAQFSAHILLKMIPELANKELIKALFVIVMTDDNLN